MRRRIKRLICALLWRHRIQWHGYPEPRRIAGVGGDWMVTGVNRCRCGEVRYLEGWTL